MKIKGDAGQESVNTSLHWKTVCVVVMKQVPRLSRFVTCSSFDIVVYQANVELQKAAQRVVDENKPRALLHQQGLSDYNIQAKLSESVLDATAQGAPKSTQMEHQLPVASQLTPDTSRRRFEGKITRLTHEAHTGLAIRLEFFRYTICHTFSRCLVSSNPDDSGRKF